MTSQQSVSPSERIGELSAINVDVAKLLNAAGQAVNALTNRPIKSASDDDEDTNMTDAEAKDTVEAHKEAFTAHTTDYYTLLQSITARLRRDVYALEEAKIIAAEAPKPGRTSQQTQAAGPPARGPAGVPGQKQPEEDRITNGGLGGLDVGWLNSRGNRVGAEKEVEFIDEAKSMLEKVLAEQ